MNQEKPVSQEQLSTQENPIQEQNKRPGRIAKVAMAAGLVGGALIGQNIEADQSSTNVEPHVQIEEIDADGELKLPELTKPTAEYEPGTAEEVVSQQETEQSNNLESTEFGTPVKEGESAPAAVTIPVTNEDVPAYEVPVDSDPVSPGNQNSAPAAEEVSEPVNPSAEVPAEETTPPLEVEISGIEAGQEYINNISSDLNATERAEKVMYIDNVQFNVSEQYQGQYGISTIYRPVVTGKDTLGYFTIDQETGTVQGKVVDARHGIIKTNGQEADENKFTNLLREHVDNEPYNKGGSEDYYRITADDEQRSFIGQATGISERKGGETPVKGGDDHYAAPKGGDMEEGYLTPEAEDELIKGGEETIHDETRKGGGDELNESEESATTK